MGADIRHGLETQVELPVEAPWTVEHVYHLFVVRVRQADRDQVLKALHDGGVGAGIHFPVPIHLQGSYSDLGLGPGSFPATERAAWQILSLPIYPEMNREQVEQVVACLRRALAG